MLGPLISSLSQRALQLGTTALMVSGAGLAGYSYFEVQQVIPGVDPSFIQRNAPLLIALGVGGMALGFMLTWWTSHRMTKRMMDQMGGGLFMPGGQPMPAGLPMPGLEVVKVRCGSCKALQAEDAAFCSSCGTRL